MKLPAALFVALILALTHAASAPLERDLGQGLAYFRLHQLPADLPIAAGGLTPVVVDLRYATTDRAGVEAMVTWLKSRARPATPIFVLLNAETAHALRQALATGKISPGIVTIGPAAAGFSPDIFVNTSPEAERRAYDTLEHGATIEALTVENRDKPRHDEAALNQEKPVPAAEAGDPEAGDPDTIDDSPKSATPAVVRAAAAPSAPIDVTLQRAIQLHRALVALKRL